MAFRRESLCLFCQCRQSVIGRRRISKSAHHARAAISSNDGFFFNNSATSEAQGEDEDEALVPLSDGHRRSERNHQYDPRTLGTINDSLSLEALTKFKEVRHAILSRLRNPWPTLAQTHGHNQNLPSSRKDELPLLADLNLPEANAALIPHATFRSLILHEGLQDKQVRRVIRAQLLRCQRPRDVYRVMAVCLQSKIGARGLSVLYEPLIRALYRCRNTVSDPQILATLSAIIARFKIADLPVSPHFLFLGLRFAARTRSLTSMQRYLRHIRKSGLLMHANVFRSVIAKFSIGHRGLGEIRNGRWQRSDLLQVLNGFDDCEHLPPEQQYHLGTFLDRNDWQYLHGWVAVLARCRDADAVWHEWELWKQSPARLEPRLLGRGGRGMTTRKRGDYWFVEQMTHSGDLERAWRILGESGLDFATFKLRVKMRLLDAVEHATPNLWDGGARDAMLEKYDVELTKVEKALGLQWRSQADGDEAEGVHELVRDQWEVMEALAAEDWTFEVDYGYPYDNDCLVPETERSLHQAEEQGHPGQHTDAG